MAYCTSANLDTRFHETALRQLVDDDVNGTDDTNVVADAIDDASHELFSYVGQRYSDQDPDQYDASTATTIPRMLRAKAARLAIYYIQQRMPGSIPDQRVFDEIIAWAQAVAAGDARIDAVTTRKVTSTHKGVARTMAPQGTLQHYGDRDPADDVGAADENHPFNTAAEGA